MTNTLQKHAVKCLRHVANNGLRRQDPTVLVGWLISLEIIWVHFYIYGSAVALFSEVSQTCHSDERYFFA